MSAMAWWMSLTAVFAASLNTRLIKGGSEPLYLPAGMADGEIAASAQHRIIFYPGLRRQRLARNRPLVSGG